ncbi:hypothetical protein AB0420_29815 [Streptomyces caelestis]|uniref:hypothetical protein n=1 Tax=Streptomyces TaxID=1883 RepID=UPI0007C57B85|nr:MULTISPECIES: hypothetical protein [unclassified Streptomyces]
MPRPAPDGEPAGFVVRDRRDFRRREADRPADRTRDAGGDPGPPAFARATVTPREDRLITEREALDVLPVLGAPARTGRTSGGGAG